MDNYNKKRTIPTSLKEKQAKQRQNTICEVQNAIDILRAEGSKITIKKLMEITGFSRSTFSKEHVDNLLRACKVCKYEEKGHLTNQIYKDKFDLQKEISILEKKIEKLQKEKKDLQNSYNKLKLEYLEEVDTNEKLRGELFVISEKCRKHNIRLELMENLED